MPLRRKIVNRALLAAFLLPGLSLGSYALYTEVTGNFHEVARGEVYRSAQLNPEELGEKANLLGIRSILNLRGKNPGKPWYDAEVAFCKERGIRHFDVPISAGKDVSQQHMDEIVTILKTSPKPLLIHCMNGADRAAFGAALYHFAIQHWPAVKASSELTMWYGHIPFITPRVAAMDRSFWSYAASHAERKP